MLAIQVDRDSHTALYRQIAGQIQQQIDGGVLSPGTRLPTVRALASQLGLTRLTVQNAYGHLQAQGSVEATVGRGTFVSARGGGVPSRSFASEPLHSPADVIGDILRWGQAAHVSSLASATPDARLFPAAAFGACLQAQHSDFHSTFGYGPAQGDVALRVALCDMLAERGIDVHPDEILVTAGVTQGLSLIAQALAQPGDSVLVEQPTYIGFLHLLRTMGLQPLGVPVDEHGPQLDALERVVTQSRPRFFYTIPTFQNPTGYSMSLERRERLVRLAATHGFLLVEDDIYGLLSYDQSSPPPLRAWDRDVSTIYISSFSKTLMPGLRLGYLLAPPPLRERLIALRLASDLGSPLLLQRTLARFLEQGLHVRHLQHVLPHYRERRDTTLAALRSSMPAEVRWSEPRGGLSCWLTLPRRVRVLELYRQALQQGWAFAPGDVFLPEGGTDSHLRLSFGSLAPDDLRRGIGVLGELINIELSQAPRTFAPSLELTSLV